MTIKELKDLVHQDKMSKTRLPPHAVPKPRLSDKSEKDLKECIKAYAKLKGWGFLTYDAKGRKLPNGKWAYSHMTKGAPDCILFVPLWDALATHVVHVEIKMPGDRQKPHQKAFQEAAEARGERYIMPSSWPTFFKLIERL